MPLTDLADTPSEFQDADDFPLLDRGAGPYNNETFNLWGYDQTRRFGLNIHLVAGGGDLSAFQATVLVYDKDDLRVGQFRGPAHPRGVDAGPVSARNITPMKHWRYEMLAPLAKLSPADSATADLDSLARELVSLKLDVNIVSPAVEQGTQGDDGVHASSGTIPRTARRYEQLCHIEGEFGLEMKTVSVHMLGARVHRRNSHSIYESGVVGHSWISGLFPSGRGFHVCIYQKSPDAAPDVRKAYWFEDGRYREVDILEFPFYSGKSSDDRTALLLEIDGEPVRIEILPTPPYLRGFTGPLMGDLPFSRAPGRFLLDGEVGGGVLERSLRRDFVESGKFAAPWKRGA